MFNPGNKDFKRDYDRLYKKDPGMANLYLLICELANEKGQVVMDEQQLAELMAARFNDPEEYAL